MIYDQGKPKNKKLMVFNCNYAPRGYVLTSEHFKPEPNDVFVLEWTYLTSNLFGFTEIPKSAEIKIFEHAEHGICGMAEYSDIKRLIAAKLLEPIKIKE